MKVKALITLVISDEKQIAIGGLYDCEEAEAKRLVSLGFAELLKNDKSTQNTPAGTQTPAGQTSSSGAPKDNKGKGGNNGKTAVPKGNK